MGVTNEYSLEIKKCGNERKIQSISFILVILHVFEIGSMLSRVFRSKDMAITKNVPADSSKSQVDFISVCGDRE